MSYSFDNCGIDSERRELHRNGIVVHLEPQVFDVLVHLVRHRDRVVSVALESKNHIILSHEPAWQRYISELSEFLQLEESERLTAPV